MNVLLAADTFSPQSSGPATYVVTLANELVKRGVAVSIVSLNRESDRSVVSCPLYKVSRRWKILRYLEYSYLLWRQAKQDDIVYAMGPVNAGLPALVAARLRRKKFVVKVVGDYAWEQSENQKSITASHRQSAGSRNGGDGRDPAQGGKIKNQKSLEYTIDEFQIARFSGKIGWLKRVESFVVGQADRVIVPCQYLQRMVIGWGAKEKKVAVIYNAVSVTAVAPAPKPAGELWLVSVGRLVPWKGMQTLIELMPEIVKELPMVRLKIVGDGPEKESLKSKVKSLKLDEHVELLGNRSHQQALSYIAAADVVVLNSGYEGLSHVLLEARQFGKKVLASSAGGNPEILEGDTRVMFPYNDRAMILMRLKEALTAPIKSGLAEPTGNMKQFQLPVMIDQTQALLASLIS